MASWPGTLPALPFPVAFQPPDRRLRTEMGAGPDKLRTRYTRETPVSVPPMMITKAQYDTLETFYVSTLAEGTLPFDHAHPATGSTVSFRFVDRPSYRGARPEAVVANRLWWASFSLEILP